MKRIFDRTGRPYSCAQVVKVLQGYLDGEVDESVARRVAAHIGVCTKCELEAETFEKIKAALHRMGEPVDRQVIERLTTYLRDLTSS